MTPISSLEIWYLRMTTCSRKATKFSINLQPRVIGFQKITFTSLKIAIRNLHLILIKLCLGIFRARRFLRSEMAVKVNTKNKFQTSSGS
jgi:hypothetical protein